ncbi:hypothetical protein MRB53_041577 [Persea americana]|nr:hypothetical protein MRB53_041577 [Persea americana]
MAYSTNSDRFSTIPAPKAPEVDASAARDAAIVSQPPPPDITPYLGLNARLSQVWINKWTILLLLVLVRLLIACASLHTGLNNAKQEALSACTSVESVGCALASMPHYLSQGVNELTASGIDKAVNGLMSMLLLSVTATEEIVVFVINLLTSTYLCLFTLVVGGSLHVALQVIEDATDFLNKTLGEIGQDIDHGIDDFQADLNKFISGLNTLASAFGAKSGIPVLNINSSLDALQHLSLPSGLDQGLSQLNDSIPNFAQVQNMTNNVIRIPFEDIKLLVNQSLNHYTFNRSLFPIPDREQLTFCSDNNGIDKFFQDLIQVSITAKKIAIVVLLLLATIACVPMAYRETRRWRTSQQRAQLISQYAPDPLDVIYIASRPYTSSAGIAMASRVAGSRRQTLVRWTVAYATTIPAIFVLSLALAGLFSCLCQYIILRAVQREVPALAYEVGAFADHVVSALNNASEHWATGTNAVINQTAFDINHDLFGWVNTSTMALNDTLNTFVDETLKVLNFTFGGTVLYGPVTGVFECLIGLKITGIERALTWVHDNAHVDFPMLPNDTFSLGAAASISNSSSAQTFLADPQQDATDQITSAVNKLTNFIASGIRTEALIATALLGMYLVIVLIGIVRALVMLRGTPSSTLTTPVSSARRIASSFFRAPTPKLYPNHTVTEIPLTDKSPVVTTAPVDPFQDSNAAPAYAEKDNKANRYRGMSYTLTPKPFPSFSLLRPGTMKGRGTNERLTSPVISSPIFLDDDDRLHMPNVLSVPESVPSSRLPPPSNTGATLQVSAVNHNRDTGREQAQNRGHERIGYAGERPVGSAERATAVRKSSYANLDDAT